MKKYLITIVALISFCFNASAQSSEFPELGEWVSVWKEHQSTFFGYPANQKSELQDFYEWYIKSDEMGRMIPEELEKELDTSRPVLMVYAMGSTFKGAIDNMEELNAVLDKHSEIPAVYRHLDAALFGGNLNHVVVMQQVSKEAIDGFIADLKKEATDVAQLQVSPSRSSTIKYIQDNNILISTPK